MENEEKLPAAFQEVSRWGLRAPPPGPACALGRQLSGSGGDAGDGRRRPLRTPGLSRAWCGAGDAARARPFILKPKANFISVFKSYEGGEVGKRTMSREERPLPGVCVQINTQCCLLRAQPRAAWRRLAAWARGLSRGPVLSLSLHGKPVLRHQQRRLRHLPGPHAGQTRPKFSVRKGRSELL